MKGLAKGLLDVALGNDHGENKRDEDATDERSRSASWAQVSKLSIVDLDYS